MITTHQLVGACCAVLALALAGCAEQSRVAPAPASPAAAASTSAPPTTSTAAADEHWTTATDPGSGASVVLPGPVQQAPFESGGLHGIAYGTTLDRGAAGLSVATVPDGYAADPDGAIQNLAAGAHAPPAVTTPVTVDGHAGKEARVDGWDGEGVAFVRSVATPHHLITVFVFAGDKLRAQRLAEHMFAGLRVP